MSLLSLDQIKTLYDDLRGRIEDGGSVINFLPVDNASGSIASFPDGADDIPVKSLIAQITPLQDLHGQSAPYPAGGSKNKLGMILSNIKTINTRGTWSGNVYTINGVSYEVLVDSANNVTGIKATGTATASAIIDLGNVIGISNGTIAILNGCPSGGSSSTYYLKFRDVDIVDTGSGKTFTVEGHNSLVAIVMNGTTANFTFYPMVRLATESDATFAPYSNICPISGWTGAKITRTGINIWDEEWEEGTIDGDGNKASATDRIRSKYFIPAKAESTYYFHVTNPTYYATTMQVGICFYDNNKTYISTTGTAVNRTFTTPANTYYLKFYTGGSGRTSHPVYQNDISINYPSTDTSYHAYNGNTINVDWTDEAGTVYGGTLNVTTGELTVNKGHVHLDGSETYNWTGAIATTSITGALITDNTTQSTIHTQNTTLKDVSWTNRANGGIGLVYGSSTLFISDSAITSQQSANDFFTANPTDVIYELATPQTYQLTPTEVKTLLGDNNIFVDTGDVSVDYRADIALYIQKVVNA